MAVSSFLFILLAAVTGILLAFEPVSNSLQPHAVSGLDKITLAQTVSAAKKQFPEIVEIKIENNRFVIADVITDDGESLQVYIDPKTAKPYGKTQSQSEFFEFVTALHRSLFLHGLGRFFVGLTSFLLLLIAVTGTVLVAKRQQKLRKFFSKIVREGFFQFYHVFLGRLWLLPILIIAASGVFLSLHRFELFHPEKISHNIDFNNARTGPVKDVGRFSSFLVPLSEVACVEFPFSADPKDTYTVKLKDRELVVNQVTGEVLSEQPHSSTDRFLGLALDLHTGRSSIAWALVLAVACVNILFFIYSGFAMTLKRRSARIRNRFNKDEAEFIVLAGSENGSTMRFAKIFHEALLKVGKTSFFCELDNYSTFASAKHLVVFTATYGSGEAPSNAKKALGRIAQNPQNPRTLFSVVAFGSHAYADFCRFGYDLYNAMSLEQALEPFLEIHTVHDKSVPEFSGFVQLWSGKTAIPLATGERSLDQKPRGLKKFKVVSKTAATKENATFLLRLRPTKKVQFTSGDLIAVYPAGYLHERQYSIGKIGRQVQLSVKLHENGLGSNYLHGLEIGDEIDARIISNDSFHFPEGAKQAILISNGTGIAPFLGMIHQNELKTECHLYCGFRFDSSFELYRQSIAGYLATGKLKKLNLAYSRQREKQYVKDLLARDAAFIASGLQNGATIMICGSLAMQNNVLELLDRICREQLEQPLGHFQAMGQIRMDCY